jgi:hypothetical protein
VFRLCGEGAGATEIARRLGKFESAHELTDNATANRPGNRVAERAERIVLGRGACRAAPYSARYDLNEKTR